MRYAMSVTLDQDNVLWLKAQFDALISAAGKYRLEKH